MDYEEIPFHKYQALGNDFVLLDARHLSVTSPSQLSRLLCRRHFGIGADGLILVSPDIQCTARMEFYNPDGSRAEICGNGIRCVARFLNRVRWTEEDGFQIMTGAGPREVKVSPGAESVSVNLGEPSFSHEDIPVRLQGEETTHVRLDAGPGVSLPDAVCLSIGNPHCVLFVEDLGRFPVQELGPRIEKLPLFPNHTNVIFGEKTGEEQIKCRVWERGAGETKACGSGAAALLVAATVRNLVPGRATVSLPGGQLDVSWDGDRGVTIAGAANEVFKGSVRLATSFCSVRSCPETTSSPAAS